MMNVWLILPIAFLLSTASMPLVCSLCIRWGRVARPRADRWHATPTPMMGGIGIFAACMITLGIFAILNPSVKIEWLLLAGSGISFILGTWDDVKRLTPQVKLIGQLIAAALVIFLGYSTTFFTPRIANPYLAQSLNILLTFVWLIGITNAVNLLDNMDGLAGGISLITATLLSYLFWSDTSTSLLPIALALAGSIGGFLVFNFPPARLFMGDSGSLFLGFTLAGLAIARQPQASNVFAVLGVPTLLFLLPILDTTLVTFTRLLRGQSPAQGGRDHTSHRLIAFGLSERQAVLILYSAAIISGLAAVFLESMAYWFSLVLMPVLLIVFSLLTAYLGGLKVVPNTTPPSQGQTLTRIMMELTYRRRVLEVTLDFFLIILCYYLSFLVLHNFMIDATFLSDLLRSLPVALVTTYLSLGLFNVYSGVWRYIGIEELLRIGRAMLSTLVLTVCSLLLFFPTLHSPVLLSIFFSIFLLICLVASRSSFRFMNRAAIGSNRAALQRVFIIGTDDSGEMALRWILVNPQLQYQPVGFITTDPMLIGRRIHNIEVFGTIDELETLIQKKRISGIILTSLTMETNERTRIAMVCRQQNCWVRIMKLEFSLLEESHRE